MSTVENILRECVKALGQDAAMEIIKNMDNSNTNTNTVTKDEKKKRIPRMTPAISTQLKSEFNNAGITQEDKEFDKSKKEFIKYVDELTDDQFSAKSLTEHMKDFVNQDKKPEEEKPKKVAKKAATKKDDDEEKPKKEKPKKETKKAATKKDDEEELQPPTNIATIHDLNLEDLQKIKLISTPAGPKNGVYWDGDNGKWVRGPEADKDEDVVEIGFKKNTYVVGEKSGRVYIESEDGGPDIFQGFVGVGEFKDMKMP